MIDTILGLFSSGGFGAIIGLVGSYFAKREDRLLLEMKYNNQIQMVTLNAKNKLDEKEAEAFVEAQKSIDTTGSAGWFISAIRPVITLYLLIITTYIAYEAANIVGGMETLPVTDVLKMYKNVIETTLMLTVMAVSFWFGSRPPHKSRIL